jgi:hypothetical protein
MSAVEDRCEEQSADDAAENDGMERGYGKPEQRDHPAGEDEAAHAIGRDAVDSYTGMRIHSTWDTSRRGRWFPGNP